MTSEPGDYVGAGRGYDFSGASGLFTVFAYDKRVLQVIYRSYDGNHVWGLEFAAKPGQQLSPGVYLGALRFATNDYGGRAGLSISGDGRGANQSYSFFEIEELVWQGNDVGAFRARFQQHGEFEIPSLSGEVAYKASPVPQPTPAQTPFPYPSTGGQTSLSMTSESGDWIGQGRSYYFTMAEGAFVAHGDAQHLQVLYRDRNFPYGEYWTLEFDAPGNQPLAAGIYTGAIRYPFNASTMAPGLEVAGNSRGSNALSGSFEIKEITLDGPLVTSFWATFEQHSEGLPPTLRGDIRYFSQTAPTPTPSPTPVPTPTPSPTPTATPEPSSSPTPPATPRPRPTPKPDREKPTLEIYGGLMRYTTSDTLLIAGRVSDNKHVSSVKIKGKGGRFENVPAFDYFSTNVPLESGRNTFWVRATDEAGNFTQVRIVATRFP